MENALENIRIVLVETWHPGNIGSAARAMKTMGLRDLWLVSPKSFPAPEATALAAEAVDLLDQAQVVSTLDEALRDCALTIASSARPRSNEMPALDVDQTVDKLLLATVSGPVALVFGPERAGLTTADVDRCQYRSMLPTAADCKSVNVAQAVQVYAYALRRAATQLPVRQLPAMATGAEREALFAAWRHALKRLNYADSEINKVMPRYRELLNRAEPTANEVRTMRGMLARIDQRAVPNEPRQG